MLDLHARAQLAARCARGAACIAALAAAVLGAGPAGLAQTPEPAPPAAAAPQTIAIGEIPQRADEELGQLDAERRERENLVEIDEIERLLPDALDVLRTRSAALEARLKDVSSFDALLDIERRFTDLRSQLEEWKQTVAERTRQAENELESLRDRTQLWERALRDARREKAPDIVESSARRVRGELDDALAEVRALRNRLLSLQGELAGGGDLLAVALARIADKQQSMLSSLLLRNEPPIWAMRANPPGARPLSERVREQLEEQQSGFARLLRDQTERGLLQFLLWLGAAVALGAARRRARAWRADEAAPGKVSLVFEHPYAIALLIALGVTRWLYVNPPPAALEASELLRLFPALLVISPLIEPALRPALLVLAGFYMLDQLRDVCEGLPFLERSLFLSEMVLGCAASAWLLQRVSRNGRLTVLTASSRQIAPLVLRGVGIAFGAVFAVGALGFMRLAQLVGDGLLGSAYASILVYAAVQIAQGALTLLLRSGALRPVHSLSHAAARLESRLQIGLHALGLGGWLLISLELLGLRRPLLDGARAVLGARLSLGSFGVSLGDVLAFGLTIGGAVLLARLLEWVLEQDVYPRLHTQRGTAYAVSTLLRYGVVLVGFIAAVSALGFDTDRLTVLLGAFGVGIGFGLQTVVNNFVSGLILLFERPVQLGDTIEVGSAQGKVRRIGIRATVVRTGDGSDVTIPNGQLLSERLTNWTMADRHRRIEVPISVSYGSDPDTVIELLVTAAAEHKNVLSIPPPVALFRGFGQTSLDFVLYAWVAEQDEWASTRSDIVRTVHRRLFELGVDIHLPQRDVRPRAPAEPAPPAESEASAAEASGAPGRPEPPPT